MSGLAETSSHQRGQPCYDAVYDGRNFAHRGDALRELRGACRGGVACGAGGGGGAGEFRHGDRNGARCGGRGEWRGVARSGAGDWIRGRVAGRRLRRSASPRGGGPAARAVTALYLRRCAFAAGGCARNGRASALRPRPLCPLACRPVDATRAHRAGRVLGRPRIFHGCMAGASSRRCGYEYARGCGYVHRVRCECGGDGRARARAGHGSVFRDGGDHRHFHLARALAGGACAAAGERGDPCTRGSSGEDGMGRARR